MIQHDGVELRCLCGTRLELPMRKLRRGEILVCPACSAVWKFDWWAPRGESVPTVGWMMVGVRKGGATK